MTKPLRFAALIRVSTEKQEQQGESLANQTKQIAAAVAQLGGTVTREYKGQQHATAGNEQHLVDSLLADAQKQRCPFDALMVADPTRWSRDNAKSATGLDILFRCGVRFFVGTSEYVLHDPTARLILAQMASIGAFLAGQQTLKSLQSKIERAKQGRPATGSTPWGRVYDKKSGTWSVDPTAQQTITVIARRYLKGESIDVLAGEFGMERTVLYDRLNRAGDNWVQTFRAPKLMIHEEVPTPIPPLLDKATLREIRKRLDTQRKFTRSQNRNFYLLANKLFCEQCGKAISPASTGGFRSYRPAVKCRCLGGGLRADTIEAAVVNQLFECLGNPAAVEAAILAAQPNLDTLQESQQRLQDIDQQLEKLKTKRRRYLNDRDHDRRPEEEINADLDELRQQELRLLETRDRHGERLAKMPTREDIRTMARKLKLKRAIGQRIADHRFPETWEEQRALIETAFNGTWDCENQDGTLSTWPMGVFVSPVPGTERKRPRPWAFIMRGRFVGELAGITGSVNTSGSCSPGPQFHIVQFRLSGTT